MIKIVIEHDIELHHLKMREIFGSINFESKNANFLLRQNLESRRWSFSIKKKNRVGFSEINHPDFYDCNRVLKWLGESIPRIIYSV